MLVCFFGITKTTLTTQIPPSFVTARSITLILRIVYFFLHTKLSDSTLCI
jgi:hypothetical protein